MASPKHIFRRYCDDCPCMYQPTGKYQIICHDCKKKRRLKVTLRLRKERLKR